MDKVPYCWGKLICHTVSVGGITKEFHTNF